MSKINIIYPKSNVKEIRGSEIPVGTYFTGKIGFEAGLFVRSFLGIIKVDDPKYTWSFDAECDLSPPVKNYNLVDVEVKIIRHKEE